jgi:hypothetical protein
LKSFYWVDDKLLTFLGNGLFDVQQLSCEQESKVNEEERCEFVDVFWLNTEGFWWYFDDNLGWFVLKCWRWWLLRGWRSWNWRLLAIIGRFTVVVDWGWSNRMSSWKRSSTATWRTYVG